MPNRPRQLPALYAAGTGPPCVDWTKFPIQPFKSLNHALRPFRLRPDKMDEVLTAFALEIYKSMVYGMLQLSHLKNEVPSSWMEHLGILRTARIPVSKEVQLVLQTIDTSTLYMSIGATLRLLDVAKICEGDPTTALVEKQRTKLLLEMKDWLLRCACCSDNVHVDTLLTQLRSVMHPQLTVERMRKSNYHVQRSERMEGEWGLWPDLTQTLAALRPPDGPPWTAEDDTNAVWAVTIYLHLACNVVRGQMFADILIRAWEEWILEHERLHMCSLESPFSPFPYRVREAASAMNYLGSWQLIEKMVLPALNREPELCMSDTYRWVMRAATHPAADPSGRVAAALNNHFDLACAISPFPSRQDIPLFLHVPGEAFALEGWLAKDGDENSISDEYRAALARGNINSRCTEPIGHPHWTYEVQGGRREYSIQDTMLDVQAPWDLHWAHEWILMHTIQLPPQGPTDWCAACRHHLFHRGQRTCVVPRLCGHKYHLECLANMLVCLDSSARLLCCVCLRLVLDKGKMVREEEARREGVPLHLTPEQWMRKKRDGVTIDTLFRVRLW